MEGEGEKGKAFTRDRESEELTMSFSGGRGCWRVWRGSVKNLHRKTEK